MKIKTYKTILKENAIRIAKDHKKHCDGEDCNISLLLLVELLDNAGIKLTKNQLSEFI